MKASPLLRATNRGFVLALLCGACIGKLELDDRVIAAEKSLSTQTEPYHYQGVPTSSSSDSTGAALERGSERKRAGVHRDECRADGRTSMLGLPINVEARQRSRCPVCQPRPPGLVHWPPERRSRNGRCARPLIQLTTGHSKAPQ